GGVAGGGSGTAAPRDGATGAGPTLGRIGSTGSGGAVSAAVRRRYWVRPGSELTDAAASSAVAAICSASTGLLASSGRGGASARGAAAALSETPSSFRAGPSDSVRYDNRSRSGGDWKEPGRRLPPSGDASPRSGVGIASTRAAVGFGSGADACTAGRPGSADTRALFAAL